MQSILDFILVGCGAWSGESRRILLNEVTALRRNVAIGSHVDASSYLESSTTLLLKYALLEVSHSSPACASEKSGLVDDMEHFCVGTARRLAGASGR